MTFFPDSTTLLKLGPLEIKWYAVAILTGAFISFYVVRSNFKKKNIPVEIADDLFVGALLSGVLGARLWYVAFSDPMSYLQNPMRILNFQEGGLAIHGGVIFGALYVYFYLKKKRYHFIDIGDEILYTVLIAQSIGRWGNFINKEAFGPVIDPASISWLPQFIQDGMVVNGQTHMPTFLYESVANLIGFLLIHFVLKKFSKPKRSDLISAYLMWYGVVRFFIEIFRTDALLVGNGTIKIAQVTSIAFVILGVLGYLGLYRKLFPLEKPVLIFDFDGTLMDTHQLIVTSFKEVFDTVETTHELTDDDYDWVVGPSLHASFEKFVINPDTEALIKQYREIMVSKHAELADEIPGAIEMLKQLKEDGYKIGIFSNKKQDMIILGMEQVGMTPYIDVVVGEGQFENGKPDPEGLFIVLQALNGYRDNLIMVGDSAGDILAGQAAGAYTIAFIQNEKRKDELLALKPNVAFSNLQEIAPHIRREVLWNQHTN